MKKIIVMLAIAACSCNNRKPIEQTKGDKNINESENIVVIGQYGFCGAVYKMKVDSVEYILVKNGSEGCAIIKHSK